MGVGDFTGFISNEIGGGNGVQPFLVAAETGKTVMEYDLTGRVTLPRGACLFPASAPARSAPYQLTESRD